MGGIYQLINLSWCEEPLLDCGVQPENIHASPFLCRVRTPYPRTGPAVPSMGVENTALVIVVFQFLFGYLELILIFSHLSPSWLIRDRNEIKISHPIGTHRRQRSNKIGMT